ncbi:MAG: tRNA uridine-5-carboxymethylaminomethyl(34) synthesis enzyme MnmG, partial [Flavobacteriales bacterium]|nr:tRNA uridine-5-carboxymethylaminomethyl(34) synthesis enzyme MnmG [Flavobacteriales bacterium]
MKKYDIIVVGGGHAGCEAAAAAANLGSNVLMISMNLTAIGQMSCNPAMGGIAKGQIIREIDALGGYSGIVSDASTIQFRMLNRSKGPAMWSPRSQNDRFRFAREWRRTLEYIPNLHFLQDTVQRIDIGPDGVLTGVQTSGGQILARAVILTSGTFMNGVMHIGEKQSLGGRAGEGASSGITEQLLGIGFQAGRMKTGTPPRVDGRSLNYQMMEEQPGDDDPKKFSFSESTSPVRNQLSCWLTHTNPEVHDLLREGFDRSPMFNGRIQGAGPRYCPSIEDKINRFSDKDSHQIFVEPEGRDTVETYVNGFSTSLPAEVQFAALRRVPGFENVRFFRPGYAVEYDYFPPTQLNHTLETKRIAGLYFAGQINGTTGYEEAACQGLMAGINAHLKLNDQGAFVLGRDEAYIGVLIDDLVTKGTDEPYRMFTSRAEFRILLRQDNADLRLTPRSHAIGLATDGRLRRVENKRMGVSGLSGLLKSESVEPVDANEILVPRGTSAIRQRVRLNDLLRRPQIGFSHLSHLSPTVIAFLSNLGALEMEVVEQLEISVKYEGYLNKEQELVEKLDRLEHIPIASDIDFSQL